MHVATSEGGHRDLLSAPLSLRDAERPEDDVTGKGEVYPPAIPSIASLTESGPAPGPDTQAVLREQLDSPGGNVPSR